MFLLFWGWRSKLLTLGPVDTWDCVTCERPRPFQLILQYRIFHLYWFMRAVTGRRYLQLCTVCSRGPELDRALAEAGLNGDPVPAGDRYSLLIGGAVLGIIVMAAVLGLI